MGQPQESRLFSRGGLAILLGLLVVLTVYVDAPLTNTDTYFHLRLGSEFLGGWKPWSPGSVTTAGSADWVPTSWLSEIMMALAQRIDGLPGVAWLFGLSVLVYAVVLYRACRRVTPAALAVVLAMLAFLGSSQFISARPQVWSYVLVVLTIDAWLRTAEDGRPRWLLVPTTWLWAMLHGMWPIGVAVGLASVAGIALDGAPWRHWARLSAIPVASFAAAGLTPVGPALYGAVLAVGERKQFFTEWAPPDFSTPVPALVGGLFAVLLVVGLRRRRTPWLIVSLSVVALGALLYSARTTPVAAAIIAPLLAVAVSPLVPGRLPIDRIERWSIAVTTVALLLILPVLTGIRASDPPAVPTWLDGAMDSLPAGTVVLSEDFIGGPLMWMYPQLDFPYSGYGDLYTIEELKAKVDLFRLNPDWMSTLAGLRAKIALLPPDSRLTRALEDQLHWRVVRSSTELVLLHAPD